MKSKIEGGSLIIEFPLDAPTAASWAVYGGGICFPKAIVNHTIPKGVWVDDPYCYAESVVQKHTLPREKTIVLLTAVPQDFVGYSHQFYADNHEVEAFATVGLGNALAAGDEGRHINYYVAGTINIIVLVHAKLSAEALLQSMSIATEAKSLYLFDQGIKSTQSDKQATGTGTDCVVVASLCQGAAVTYAGKHSKMGELIAHATIEAMDKSLEKRREA